MKAPANKEFLVRTGRYDTCRKASTQNVAFVTILVEGSITSPNFVKANNLGLLTELSLSHGQET